MRSFDLGGGSFFMCTEISPRCYTIQQVSDVDLALKEVIVRRNSETSASASFSVSFAKPSLPRPFSCAAVADHSFCPSNSSVPMLPWWFTAECRQHLMGVPPPADEHTVTPDIRPPSSIGAQPMSQEQLRERVQRQLEYYFSRENLINDRYLRCQMDADQYVPIKIVANFPKVTQLTTDLALIVDVLKSSSHVQVDETGQKVRPMSKRCTIILREIPHDADENEVKAMFGDDCPPYQTLSYGLNNSWYVTFSTEQDTQKAFFHLQTLGKTFNGNPVFARIKTGGAPLGADIHAGNAYRTPEGNTHIPLTLNGGTLRGQLIVHHGHTDQTELVNRSTPSPSNCRGEDSSEKADLDLGKILAQHGYSPRATFRPLAPPATVQQPMAVPQPTSYFVQPILHNDHCSSHQIVTYGHNFCPHRIEEERVVTAQMLSSFEEERPFVLCDAEHACASCADVNNFSDSVSDCIGEHVPHLMWEQKEDSRLFRKRKRNRAESEPALAYCSTHFAVGRNEFVLRKCAKEDNCSWDPDKLGATMLPSPVPRITDVPRLTGKSGILAKDGSGDETEDKHCTTPAGGSLAGFQRQESVEAYQIAVAANGVAKQRRITLEIEEEEWEPVSHRKTRNKSMEKCQDRQLHSSDITASGAPNPRLTTGPIATGEKHTVRKLSHLFGAHSVDSVQPRPLNDSANYYCCHKNYHSVTTKICRFLKRPNQNFIWDNNASMGKPSHQSTPKTASRVQPLLSLSATWSPLCSSAFQQHRRPICTGPYIGGGRRVVVETGRNCIGSSGKAWANGWCQPMPIASNMSTKHTQQQNFVETNSPNAQNESGMTMKMEVGTIKRVKRPIERVASGHEAEGETRPSRNKTSDHKRQPSLYARQNALILSRKQQFRRNSRERTEKEGRVQKIKDGTATEGGGATKKLPLFNFEECEFPALLSCTFASSNIGVRNSGDGHVQRQQKLSTENISTNAITFPVASPEVLSTVDCVSIDPTSTTNLSNIAQLQFSAVVAGNGRRRATIGMTTAEGRRKVTGEKDTRAGHSDRSEDGAQQQRSGTIGTTERSYAQMLKG